MSRRLRAGLHVLLAALLIAPSGIAADATSLPELNAHDIVVGRFIQRRHLPQLERPIASSGRFAYERGRGLLWQVTEPIASSLVIAADGVFQDGEPVEGAGALRAVAPVFGALFAGESDRLGRHFEVDREATETGWRLQLRPRDATLAAAIERIVVAGQSGPDSLVLIGANGGRTELAFDDIRYPARLDEDLRRAFGRGR